MQSQTVREHSSAGSERLPYKQRVGGSNPSAPTKRSISVGLFFCTLTFFGYFCRKPPLMEIRIGQGYDVHALKEGLPMYLGGVRIESTYGFVAHSDGDVAIHALCDALLGALALGDIGKHFPDTSDEFKGIDSKELLSRVMRMVGDLDWTVSNVDITIALQSPKIGKYVPEMRRVLSEVMGIGGERVSVKATTTERLGFVGRGEGCEVWAVALLQRP